MKRSIMRPLLAGVMALALFISCAVSGLVLPAAATTVTPTKLTLTYDTLWIMTGRTRSMGSSTVSYSDKTSATVAGNAITWKIANTAVATVSTDGLITPKAVGETTITGTLTGATDANGQAVTATCVLHVVDGSPYVYADVPYTLGNELIANGDFEQGGTYWGNSANVVAGAGKNGGYGFRLDAAGRQYYKNAIALNPNTTYVLSYDYLPGKDSSFFIDGSRFQAGRKTHTYGESVTREWQTFSKVFTTSPTMSLSVGWDLLINATKADAEEPVIIDNISVREYISERDVETLVLSHEAMTMYPTQTQTLTAYADPYGGNLNGITWESSDTEVVTVSNGVVTAIDTGTATLTATAVNGKTATCVITVTGEKPFLKNGTFEGADKSMWEAGGVLVSYPTDISGTVGDTVLKLQYNYPVSQTVIGLQPNTTYTVKGSAKLETAAKYVGITVVCGGEVLFSKISEEYTADWDTTKNSEGVAVAAPFADGYTFTTPATLSSDTATVTFSLLKDGDTPATAASAARNSRVSQGDNDVVDNDGDEALNFYAYLNNVELYVPMGDDVDLTVTALSWTGDDNGQVDPGKEIVFSATVKNLGTDDIPVGKTFTVDFSAGTEVVRTATYSGGVPAGEEVIITAAPWTAVAGDHMIAARVNAAWDIMETHMAGNNTYQLNLRVATDRLAPTYGNVAAAVQQAGMNRLTMSDDFDSLDTVDRYASGIEGYKWYVTRPWGATTLTVNDYTVNTDETGNGILTLMAENPIYNLALNSVDVNTLNGFRYQQGYLEVRLRIVRPSANGQGEEGVPAVWSFTQDKALEQGLQKHGLTSSSDTDWVELDWLEYWGISKQYPNGYYTTTLHDSTTLAEEPSYRNSNAHLKGLGDAEWHVMGWLWEKNSIRCFLDGVEVMNQFYDPEASAVPNASVNTTTVKHEDGTTTTTTYGGKGTDAGVFSWANDEAAVLYLSGSKDNPMEVDYVRIWQTGETTAVSDNMTMERSEVTVSEHDRERLTVMVPTGEDAGTLRWASSNPSVATVHGNGEVYARNAGTAIVTATNANGQSVWCTVTVTHNLLTGADFEWDNDLLHKNWVYSVLNNAAYAALAADPADPTNQVLQLKPMEASQACYYFFLPVEKGKTYRLTGKFKGTGTLYTYFSGSYLQSAVDLNKASDAGKPGWKYLTGVNQDANGWKSFALEFTAKADPSGWNTNYIFAFGNSASTDCYVDDLMMTEANNASQSAYTLTVNTVTNGTVTLKADGNTVSNGAALSPGTVVEVAVTPSAGYQLALGSLQYTYTVPARDGSYEVERRILNKNSDEFGAGDGFRFRMVMPAADTTLTAAFERVSTCSMPVATLGTSVSLDEGQGIKGVRFLNRLYVTDWDANGDGVYVTYNGQKRRVMQCGALIKRASNTAVDLTLENYEAHKNDGSATRIWAAVGYNGRSMRLVDYTASYVDFTVVMTSSVANRQAFLDREYTTCAYVVLDDGTTLYTEAFTDSVLGALERQE